MSTSLPLTTTEKLSCSKKDSTLSPQNDRDSLISYPVFHLVFYSRNLFPYFIPVYLFDTWQARCHLAEGRLQGWQLMSPFFKLGGWSGKFLIISLYVGELNPLRLPFDRSLPRRLPVYLL